MTTQKKLMTAEEFMALDREGRFELVRGELIEMAPAGGKHGLVAWQFVRKLDRYLDQTNAGALFIAEASFRLIHAPDLVRTPNVAFVAWERLPQPVPEGAFDIPPDLAIEVISPTDRLIKVDEKVQDWLDGGTRLVWTAHPRRRTVKVSRPGREPRLLTEADTLDGEDVLPGFQCPVADLFSDR